MNQDPNPPPSPFFYPFELTQWIFVRVSISRRIHFMQQIVSLFGPTTLDEVMASPHPIILPLFLYEHGFNVHEYILI